MRKKTIVAALALVATVTVGCGRSYVLERQLGEQVKTYVQAVTERRLDDAKRMLTGEALVAAEIAFPMIQAAGVKQKLLSFEAKADPVTKNDSRATVLATYKTETEVPGLGTVTEETKAAYDLIRDGDTWKIYRVSILDSKKEGVK